jgi:uncharacterized protein (TIGR03435 family)
MNEMITTTHTLVVCAIACLTIATRSGAQEFEAADIHPSVGTEGIHLPGGINSNMRGGFIRGGRYELHNATIVDLTRIAYGVDSEKVVGGPSWLDTDKFDVIAKGPADTTPDSLRLMLQALLADRFKLVVHHATKPFPEYALTAGKHPQLKEATGGESTCQSPPVPGAATISTVSCHNITMAEFASRLPRMALNYFGLTSIVDLSGLTGSWDFTIKWTPRALFAAAGSDAISIFDAVEKQLGLKLEVKDVPMPVLAVDSVNEKPTDNPPGISQILPPIQTAFEVADIKPTAPESTQRGFRWTRGGRIDLRGVTLKELIKGAWEMTDGDAIDNDELLAGAPKWLDAERFDIVATTSSALSASGQSIDMDSVHLMLRALLADRFKLATHIEELPVSAYALVSARPKLKKADPSNRPGCRSAPAPSGSTAIFSMACQNVTMAQLAEQMQAWGGIYVTHPVFDATGLEGGWDFILSWSPPHLIRNGEAGPLSAAAPVAADPNGALTLVEALDKQLGLKLELQKHPMPVLVIDHVEPKPTDN